jgi:hypothetical protein
MASRQSFDPDIQEALANLVKTIAASNSDPEKPTFGGAIALFNSANGDHLALDVTTLECGAGESLELRENDQGELELQCV